MQRNLSLLAIGIIVSGIVACQAAQPVPEYDGAMLYMGYCASCHGPAGQGDGPLADQLVTTMQDLGTIQSRNRGVFPRDELRAAIDGRTLRAAHGTQDMPVWGWQFNQAEAQEQEPERYVAARIDALLDFLENIQQH
jgi:mono/diheme cytochrome c family protein